jgi:hypothetical protein
MMTTPTTTRQHCELRAILHVIRQRWSEEERNRRQRIAEVKQKWLLAHLDGTGVQSRAS